MMESSGYDTPPEEEEDIGVMTARKLRLDYNLMTTLKASQQRCLCVYTHKPDPPIEHNRALISVKREVKSWGVKHDNLLKDIITWREEKAKVYEVDPSSVVTIEFAIKIVRGLAMEVLKWCPKDEEEVEKVRKFSDL